LLFDSGLFCVVSGLTDATIPIERRTFRLDRLALRPALKAPMFTFEGRLTKRVKTSRSMMIGLRIQARPASFNIWNYLFD
jgi:hypothetical protein